MESQLIEIHPESAMDPDSTIIWKESLFCEYFSEFRNDPDVLVVYAGLVAGPKGFILINTDAETLQNYLRPMITPTTKLVFDNSTEGNFDITLSAVHITISNLPIDPARVYLVIGAIDAKKEADSYYSRFSYDRINICVINIWEGMVKNPNIDTPKYLISNKSKNFLCFNRMTRRHRVALLALLYKENLVDNSFYSYFANGTHTGLDTEIDLSVLDNLVNEFSKEDYDELRVAYLANRHKFPLKLNIDVLENQTWIKPSDTELFDNSYFSVVTETFFFAGAWRKFKTENNVFFSEKIFKPLWMKHPFILVARPNSLAYLKRLGFKTYSPFIDETYDTIENDADRLKAIVKEIKRLSDQTPEQWIEMLTNIKSIAEYNHYVIERRHPSEYAVERIKAK